MKKPREVVASYRMTPAMKAHVKAKARHCHISQNGVITGLIVKDMESRKVPRAARKSA